MDPVSKKSDAERVLQSVIDDGAFEGGAVIPLSHDHAVSFDEVNRVAALACGGGWMPLPFDVIQSLAAKAPH